MNNTQDQIDRNRELAEQGYHMHPTCAECGAAEHLCTCEVYVCECCRAIGPCDCSAEEEARGGYAVGQLLVSAGDVNPVPYRCASRILDDGIASFFNHDNGWFSGLDDDGNQTWNHRAGAEDELTKRLGRVLRPVEQDLLSLSLCYGPTPTLSDPERSRAIKALWPDGNPCGMARAPEAVAEVLS